MKNHDNVLKSWNNLRQKSVEFKVLAKFSILYSHG